ncbi:tetratricopeptide repeat protein [Hymenobacter metallilatus]|nr:tetratricopeptide repeat protein [Hymenobacter metallilatus]
MRFGSALRNFFGLNMNYNKRRAMYWYKKACEGNMADACNNLATCYYSEGKKEEAISLYKKAVNLGSVLAKKNLRGLL